MIEGLKVFGTIVGIFLMVVLGVGLIMGLIAQLEIPASIAEFISVKTTVETARANPAITSVELAALQQKIVDENRWLARVKYFKGLPVVGFFIKNRVKDLEPIQ
jgi:small basic protein